MSTYMIEKGKGGANTKTGLVFEERNDLLAKLAKVPGYTINGNDVFFNGKLVATRYKKISFYTQLLHKIDFKSIISKRLLPDDALLVPDKQTVYIIEMKFQKVAGSVDEKLQTCDFKKRQYSKLLAPLGYKAEYIYVLSDWFDHKSYRDVQRYITDVGCYFFFNELPLSAIGLPTMQQ